MSGSLQDTQPYKTGSISSFLPPLVKPGDATGPKSTKGYPEGAIGHPGPVPGAWSQARPFGPQSCSQSPQAAGTWTHDLTFLRFTFSFEIWGKFYPPHEGFKELCISLPSFSLQICIEIYSVPYLKSTGVQRWASCYLCP